MSLSKELRKCFVCFKPTKKFGKTDDKFLSTVMWLRLKGQLPYPPEGSPVFIKDWDPCQSCVPKTLDLYKRYTKLQKILEEKRGPVKGKEMTDNDSDISSEDSGDDESNKDEEEWKHAEEKHIFYGDYLTPDEDEEAEVLRKKKKGRRTKGPTGQEECTEQSYKCPKCPLQFTLKYLMARHISYGHREDERRQSDDSNRSKEVPLKSVGEEEEFPQQHVASKDARTLNHTKKRSSLSTVRKEKSKTSLKCPHCSISFKTNGLRQRHISGVHERVRTFKCPQCPISFKTNYLRKRHIKGVHEGVRDFKCHQCPISFTSNYHRQRHIRAVHERVRDFKCPRCRQTFTQRSYLRDHVAIVHEGRVLYKCPRPNCKSTFTQKQSINIHVQSVHEKRRDFKCPICLKGFFRKTDCNSHVRNVHKQTR